MIQTEPHLQDYIQVILRRRWIIITFFSVLVTTVLIGSLRQIPIYRATATIMIEHRRPQIVSVGEVTTMGPTGEYRGYSDYYETQYKLIKSCTLLKKVANSLGLEYNNSHKGTDPAEALSGVVKVKPVKGSQLVEINAENTDPWMSARIANTVAEEYIKQNLERNINATSDAAEWLSKKIEEQRQKLRGAELVLQKYRKEQDVNIIPELTGDDAIESIKTEYAGLQALLANYSERYTDDHPKMVELKAQINSLKNKIQGLEDIDLGGKAMEYRVLERDVQSNKHMYEILLARFKEIDVSSNLNVNNISIIDRAKVPERPIKPNLKLNMMLAVVVGLVMGTGLGFFVDYLDTTIKSPEDIKDILESHFLGAIPEMKEKVEVKRDRIAYLEPKSPVSESYKAIRTELCQLMRQGDSLKTILITSAEPQAGKTVTISNLGIALSQQGNSVLLVDGDLRRPQLHRIFNLGKEMGLTEYLSDGTNIESIIKDTDIDNLKVITSGKVPRNPAERIACAKMREFIAEVKNRFDFILFDSPPMISVTDATILADMLDVSVQIVRSGRALVPIALSAKEKLAQAKAKNLGAILNDIKTYHGHYYYYYHRYYHYYGDENKGRDSSNKSFRKSKGKPDSSLDKTWDSLKSESRKIMFLIKDKINTYKNNKFKNREK